MRPRRSFSPLIDDSVARGKPLSRFRQGHDNSGVSSGPDHRRRDVTLCRGEFWGCDIQTLVQPRTSSAGQFGMHRRRCKSFLQNGESVMICGLRPGFVSPFSEVQSKRQNRPTGNQATGRGAPRCASGDRKQRPTKIRAAGLPGSRAVKIRHEVLLATNTRSKRLVGQCE